MAIINKGQVLLTGKPHTAIAQLNERVWSAIVGKSDLPDYQKKYNVLSTRLVGGQPVIHVYSEVQPEAGFHKIDPDLEDVYFQHLNAHKTQAA